MKPVDLTIWNCHQLRRVEAIEFTATINFGTMSARGRNSLLRMVRGAWVTSSAHTGVGLLAFKLMETTGAWFLSGKIRGWRQLFWAHNTMPAPAGFEGGMKRLLEADKVAAAVAEESNQWYQPQGMPRAQVFHKLKPQDHVAELLANHVASAAYQEAIAPLVKAIEGRGTYQVAVKNPRGSHWRQ